MIIAAIIVFAGMVETAPIAKMATNLFAGMTATAPIAGRDDNRGDNRFSP